MYEIMSHDKSCPYKEILIKVSMDIWESDQIHLSLRAMYDVTHMAVRYISILYSNNNKNRLFNIKLDKMKFIYIKYYHI